jgi:diacylglycerol O-acyltransferase / wax synthase
VPRLHALDAVWLELERDGPPVATGLVSILEGPPPSIDEVRRLVGERVADVPSLRWVLEPAQRLHRPRWRDAGPPDLRQHVWSARVAAAEESLEEFVSSMMQRPMDRRRPLWEIAVVRGLPDGRWAFVWRLHHAVADGQGAQALLGELFDVTADGSRRMSEQLAAFRPNARGNGSPSGSPRSVAAHAVTTAVGTVLSTLRHLPEAAHLVADLTPRPPGSVTGALSDRRRWVLGTAPLVEAKRAARRYDVTVNDIILAAVATGFREMLLARGDVVERRSLRCVLPVSLRSPDDSSLDNKVSAAWADLPVGDLTLGERARSIARTTSWQKQVGTPAIGGLLIDLTDRLVPAPVQEAVISHARWFPEWMADTLVTNVPGAPFPLYVLGRQMHLAYPIIPVDAHLRVIVGVVSHDGWLCFGVTGDGLHAADVDVLRDGAVTALTPLP